MKLSRSTGQTCITLRLSVLLAVLLFGLPSAHGQELTTTNVTERMRLLEAELERQNAKLDQLQKTITDQQTAIQALLEKLSVKLSAESVSPTAVEENPVEAPEQAQTPTVEQRLAKVEGQALKIGPVRFSGDFRLRFDGIFRSATEPPDPPLDHVQ